MAQFCTELLPCILLLQSDVKNMYWHFDLISTETAEALPEHFCNTGE